LQDEEKAHQYGSQGREWVIKEWRWENWATKFNSLLIEG